jgi:mannose-6-phosphate isomerase-like protein (cupin superfamily)
MGPMNRLGFVVAAGTGTQVPGVGGELLASQSDTGGAFSLLVSHAPTGDQVPLHVHEEVDEAFFILNGQYRITCGEQTWHAGTHDFVFLPRGLPQAYEVVHGLASKLILVAPGGIESFFKDLAAGASPVALTHRHGVRFLH